MARELGVDYAVDGAVRRQGSALRVSANLIEARTGAILWAEQFRGSLDDIFSIQESLSRSIVDALRIGSASMSANASLRAHFLM